VLPVVIVVVVIIVLLVLLDVFFYNGLVKLKNKVEAAWAQIDVQLSGAPSSSPTSSRP
jgi:LemA protein